MIQHFPMCLAINMYKIQGDMQVHWGFMMFHAKFQAVSSEFVAQWH
jgi:hypothetical protein